MSEDLLAEARRLLDAGDPRSARELAEQARAAAGTSEAAETRWRAAHLLGEALFDLGDVARARVLAGEALRLSQASGDPEALGSDLNLLGVIELTEERFDEALFLLRRSYDLRAQALGEDASGAIESLNNLAAALWRVGREDEALALHEDALRRCERAFGENHHRTAETLIALAVKLGTRPESKAHARALDERALAAADAAHAGDSLLVARAAANVAIARMNAGDFQSVGPLLARAVELHERHYGPESRWTARVVHARGLHAYHHGRYDDARSAFERALSIGMRELGPEHPETISAAKELWGTLQALAEGELDTPASDDLDEAMALELVCLALDPELEGAIPGGGSLERSQAAEQLRRIAERIEIRAAPDPARAAALKRAAELVENADVGYRSGDLGAAAGALREAIAVLEAACGPADLALLEPLRSLRRVHWAARTESELLPVLRRIASILSEAYGERHPRAIDALCDVYWQERREHGPAGGRETAARIESLLRALGEPSDHFQGADGVIAAARSAEAAGAELEEPPLSARRERFLAEPSALADELLADLDQTPWARLDHAHGPAIDTPLNLRLLLAEDERLRHDALERLDESLLGHGRTHSATAPALHFVSRLAEHERVPGRPELVRFLKAAPRG